MSKCKPSITVCDRVVQNCPYYTPSRYQSDVSIDDNDTGECTHERMREVAYGGLPAFMCPSKGELLKLNIIHRKYLVGENFGEPCR